MTDAAGGREAPLVTSASRPPATTPLPPMTLERARARSAELSGLASPVLRAKARDLGVDREQLASLKDTSFDVNAAIISLILGRLEDPTARLPYTGQRALAHDSGSRTAGLSRWSEAARAGGLSTSGVIFWAVVRLAWHAGPPLLFLWTSIELGQCMAELPPESSGSGSGLSVSGRRNDSIVGGSFSWIINCWWIFCLACVAACVCANPAFLLVDLRASFRDGYFTQGRQDATGGWFFCAIYFLETEMFVASAINARWRLSERRVHKQSPAPATTCWFCRVSGVSWYGWIMGIGSFVQLCGALMFLGVLVGDTPDGCAAWMTHVLTVAYGMCVIGVLFKIIHVQYSCYGSAHGDTSVDHTGIPGSPVTGSAHGAGAALSPAANAAAPLTRGPSVDLDPLFLETRTADNP